MINFLGAVLVISNLILALLTFVLLARPEKLLGILARIAGVRDEWRLGYLLEADRDRLLHLGRAIGFPALLLLFMWSFFCGVMIRLFV